jgi:hypothetical protein
MRYVVIRRSLPDLLRPIVRVGVAVGALAFVGSAWVGAGHASRDALREAQASLSRVNVEPPTHLQQVLAARR